MELVKHIPSQLIWSLITCTCLRAIFFSFELNKFYFNNNSRPDLTKSAEERNNKNHEQLAIVNKSLAKLSEKIGIPVGLQGTNLTEAEVRVLKDYVRKNIILTPDQQRKYSSLTKNPAPAAAYNNQTLLLEIKLKELVAGQRNGFYVESRGRDGTNFNSFTLEKLEKELGWSGLIIEGVPDLLAKLLSQNRAASIAQACLSQNTTEYMEYFWPKNTSLSLASTKHRTTSRTGSPSSSSPKLITPTILELSKKLAGQPARLIECFPLQFLLESLNIFSSNSIDLLILDLDGTEYKVLNNLPDAFSIKIIVLQHLLAPEGKNAFKGLMYRKKYFLTFESDSHYIFIQKKFLLGPILK